METLQLKQPLAPSQQATPPPTSTPPPQPSTEPSDIDNPADGLLTENDFDRDFFQTKKMSADSVLNDAGTIETAPTIASAEPVLISMDEAARTTATLIEVRDTIQSFGISFYADGDMKHAADYSYENWQKEKLIRAYTPIVHKANLTISPWVDVLVAEAICTGPLVALTFKNRNLRIENERMAKKIAELQREKNSPENVYANKSTRTDGKNVWTIDKDGYYTYTPKNSYIPKEKRTEKPQLTAENYELLVKHNGKEMVDKIFNIN